MAIAYTQTDSAAPLGVIQACAPMAPSGDADAVEAVDGGTAGTTALSVAIPSGSTVTAFATELRIADTDSLDSGTLVHRLNVSTAQGNLTLEAVYVCRVNSSGVSQETLGSVTGLGTDISAGGVFSTNVTLSAASAHNAGDRVYIVLVVANSHLHTSRTLEVLPNQDIDTPFVAASNDVDVQASTATLSLATFSATIALHRTVAPSAVALALATFPAAVNAATEIQASTAALSLATQTATITTVSAVLEQGGYRFRNDDGTETAATWLEAENTPAEVSIPATFRLRVVTNETGGATEGSYQPALEYRKNGGSWTTPGALSSGADIAYASSGTVSDETATTDQIGGDGTFAGGHVTSGDDVETSVSLTGDGHTEHEWSLVANATGDYEFRLTDQGTPLDSYPASARGIFTADVATLTLTTFAATVSQTTDTHVQAGTAALSLATSPATVNAETSVSAGTAGLTLSTAPATVSLHRTVDAGTASLALTSASASVTLDKGVEAGTASLTLTTFPASLAQSTNVQATTASLALTTLPASVNAETNVQAGTAALALETHPAAIGQDTNISADTAALTLETQPATVNAETSITASAAALSLTTFPATVNAGRTVEASTATLALAASAASVNAATNVEAGTASLAVATYPASVTLGGDTEVQATTQALTLATLPATISLHVEIQATAAGLVLSTEGASVNLDRQVAAGFEALVLATYGATVAGGGLLPTFGRNYAVRSVLRVSTGSASVANVNSGTASVLNRNSATRSVEP